MTYIVEYIASKKVEKAYPSKMVWKKELLEFGKKIAGKSQNIYCGTVLRFMSWQGNVISLLVRLWPITALSSLDFLAGNFNISK